MQDASRTPSDTKLPVVLTPEDIYLYLFGGSSAGWKTRDELQAMSIAELLDYGQQHRTNHLTPEKRIILETQLADPDSWVNRAKKMLEEQNNGRQDIDWFEVLSNPARKRSGQPLYQPPHAPRGNPQTAIDREIIVRFIRARSADGRLSEKQAALILAEAGESLSWIDSVPDRMAISEPIAPLRGGSPTQRRKYIATHYPVLSDLMADQNSKMHERLNEAQPILAAELQHRLTESRNDHGPGGGSPSAER
jgi:hypothetical protein